MGDGWVGACVGGRERVREWVGGWWLGWWVSGWVGGRVGGCGRSGVGRRASGWVRVRSVRFTRFRV